MAMSGRNTRAIHTEDRRIRQRLAQHRELMTKFEAMGADTATASKLAFNVTMKRITLEAALAGFAKEQP